MLFAPFLVLLYLPALLSDNFLILLNRQEYKVDLFSTSLPQTQLSCMQDQPQPEPKKSKKRQITPQLCFFRNLFYNMEMSIGGSKFKLALDLLSPYTWIKGNACESCYSSEQGTNCIKKCEMPGFSKTHTCDVKKKCKSTNIQASLDYVNHNFTGNISYETIRLKDKFDDEKLSIKKFKIIDMQKIYNAPHYLSDGALGLSPEDDASKEDQPEEDAGIVTAMANAQKNTEVTMFSLYIRENGVSDSENSLYQPTIIFGEPEQDFIRFPENLADAIPVNKDSLFDWDLPLQKITINKQEITLSKPSGVLTLSTTYIALPQKEINSVISILNNISPSPSCSLSSNPLAIIFCQNLAPQLITDLEILFTFLNMKNQSYIIPLNSKNIVGDCQKKENGDNSCYLNIHKSSSGSVILGEAFLKDFYTVFDMENDIVGMMEAVTKETETVVEQVKETGRKYSKFLKYFFIVIGVLLVVLCPLYLWQVYKILKRRKNNENWEDPNVLQLGDDPNYDLGADVKEKMERKKREEEEKMKGQI